MPLQDLLRTAFYLFITMTSITALAVSLFGATAALERWLDGQGLRQTSRPRLEHVDRIAGATVVEVEARNPAA